MNIFKAFLPFSLFLIVASSIISQVQFFPRIHSVVEEFEAKSQAYVENHIEISGKKAKDRDASLLIKDLEADPQATNVHLSWQAFDVPAGETGGYNIYRRTANGEYGEPVGYTGTTPIYPEPRYTDDRLEPDRTYYYKIRARNKHLDEYGESEEVEVTTESSTGGYYTYANLNTAVVIYKHAMDSDGEIYEMTESDVEDIIEHWEVAREFVWRNTNMKLNLDTRYYVFDEFTEDFKNTNASTSVPVTGKHLQKKYGVINTQYDMVFRATGATGGNFSWGASDRLDLPGPERGTGFSQLSWPVTHRENDPARYPDYFPDNNASNNQIWLMTHETQHAIDAIYRVNGFPEKGHGDRPQHYGQNPEDFPQAVDVRYGRRFDFQATLYRTFDPTFQVYEKLPADWGQIIETVDADGDGFPDLDPRVPLDEARFGSSPEHKDTSGDGLDDKASATDGYFQYSYADPNSTDTSGDGVADGETDYPRYRNLNTFVNHTGKDGNPFTPVIDGDLSEWPDDRLVSDSTSWASHNQTYAPKVYMTYDEDYLYVAMDLPDHGRPEIKFDFNAGGWWFGRGNTELNFDIEKGTIQRIRSWDGSPEGRDLAQRELGRDNGLFDNNSTYRDEFGRRVFTRDDIEMEMSKEGPEIKIEFAVPCNEFAGLNLRDGDEFGFMVDYHEVNDIEAYATTFDQWKFIYFTLGGKERLTSTE